MSRRTGRRRVAVVVAALALATGAVVPAATAIATGDRATFTRPLDTDSRWFPLVPETRMTYRGTVIDETGTHRHTVAFTVTDLVKKVGGVNARVILDVDTLDGVTSEAELAFFSQDDAGNVWTMGEYPEEYRNGHFASAPSVWISGQSGARAGILVPGHPTLGARFVQGRAPAVGFLDVGKVVSVDGDVCTPLRCYGHVASIRETAPTQPHDGFQLKQYAPGTGLVTVAADGGGSQEQMTLSRIEHLGPAALAQVHFQALSLEARAYRNKEDYRATQPAHLPGHP